MADIARLEQALRNADAAGDVDAAKVFAAEIRKMQGGLSQTPPNAGFETQASTLDPVDLSIARSKNDPFGEYLRGKAQNPKAGEAPEARDARLYGQPMRGPSKLTSGIAGAADTASFGFGDEIAAGMSAMTGPEDYKMALAGIREAQQIAQGENPKSYLAGQVVGGVAQGAGLTGAGLTTARMVPTVTTGAKQLGARMLAGGADGLAQGAAYGFGSGEGGLEERGKSALINGGLGLAMGSAAPAIVSGVRGAFQRLGMGAQGTASDKLMAVLGRAGMSPDDIAAKMREADALGYGGQYTAADALGIPGQNSLAAVTRSASHAGDEAQKMLDARMSEAPRRLASAFDEAGGVGGQTAKQLASELKKERSVLGLAEYGAARDASGAIDVSGAIGKADEFLTPGVNKLVSPQSGIADDSVEAAMRKARSFLTDGKSTLTDFDSVMRAKMEIQNLADAAKPGSDKARRLKDMVFALDDSLANASEPYAKARDTWKSYSRAGEAVDEGTAAATRGRFKDTIPAFQAKDDLGKQGFSAGYYDNLAGTVENNPSRVAGVLRELNAPQSARQQEVQAISGPAGNTLLSKAKIEQDMLDTYNATKGSRTALNLSEDAAGGSGAGGMIKAALTGNFGNMAKSVLDFGVDRLTGQTNSSRELIARALLGQGPQAAAQIAKAIEKNVGSKQKADAIMRALLVGSSLPAGQLGKPNP